MVEAMAENSISPLLYLGIGLFLLPVLMGFLHVTMPTGIYTAGIVVIILGAFHTMLMRRPK